MDRLNKTIESLRAALCAHGHKHRCEILYVQGHVNDTAESLIEMRNTARESARSHKLIDDWYPGTFQYRTFHESIQFPPSEFTHRCVSTLERTGDEASKVKNHEKAIVAYSTALSLSHSTPKTNILIKWASAMLTRSSPNEALGAAARVRFA